MNLNPVFPIILEPLAFRLATCHAPMTQSHRHIVIAVEIADFLVISDNITLKIACETLLKVDKGWVLGI